MHLFSRIYGINNLINIYRSTVHSQQYGLEEASPTGLLALRIIQGDTLLV